MQWSISIDISSNEDTTDKEETSTKGLTEIELKDLEDNLAKSLPSDQVGNTLKILRGFRVGATKQEQNIAIVGSNIKNLKIILYIKFFNRYNVVIFIHLFIFR